MSSSNFAAVEQCPSTARPPGVAGRTPWPQDRERRLPAAVTPAPDAAVYAGHAARLSAAQRKEGAIRAGPLLDRLRVSELKRVDLDAYEGGVVDTFQAGERLFACALPHLLGLPTVLRRTGAPGAGDLAEFAYCHTPAFYRGKGGARYFDDLRRAFEAGECEKPLRMKADTVARALGLTLAERTRLKLRTIGASDRVKAEREKDARAKDAAYQLEKRRAAGAVPRARYEGASAAQTQPWVTLGLSRSTYYKRRKAGTLPCETTPSARETSPSAIGGSTPYYRSSDGPVSHPASRVRNRCKPSEGVEAQGEALSPPPLIRHTQPLRSEKPEGQAPRVPVEPECPAPAGQPPCGGGIPQSRPGTRWGPERPPISSQDEQGGQAFTPRPTANHEAPPRSPPSMLLEVAVSDHFASVAHGRLPVPRSPPQSVAGPMDRDEPPPLPLRPLMMPPRPPSTPIQGRANISDGVWRLIGGLGARPRASPASHPPPPSPGTPTAATLAA